MYRYDARRGSSTPQVLSKDLHLQWSRKLPKPAAAWPPEQDKIQFDTSYEPIVSGQLLVIPSMVHDGLTAYNTRTGQQQWQFYTNGPVRFAPLAHRGKIYCVSDDGNLYCLKATNGKLVWKYRGGPSDRQVLGNDRLISMWPARGAAVLQDNTIYFAAGIWPFMGIFIHAVDVESGEAVWTNSGSGSNYLAATQKPRLCRCGASRLFGSQ